MGRLVQDVPPYQMTIAVQPPAEVVADTVGSRVIFIQKPRSAA